MEGARGSNEGERTMTSSISFIVKVLLAMLQAPSSSRLYWYLRRVS